VVIIGNIKNNIVVICEIKSFYVTLAAGKYFPNNIHRANYHFTHSKKLKKTDNITVLPLGGIVYGKKPQEKKSLLESSKENCEFGHAGSSNHEIKSQGLVVLWDCFVVPATASLTIVHNCPDSR
jgi:hypothetical protein